VTKPRINIVMDEELLAEIDRATGKGERSDFLSEAARQRLEREAFIVLVTASAGAWARADSLRPATEAELKTLLAPLRRQPDAR
jgi:hypothetical protein